MSKKNKKINMAIIGSGPVGLYLILNILIYYYKFEFPLKKIHVYY